MRKRKQTLLRVECDREKHRCLLFRTLLLARKGRKFRLTVSILDEVPRGPTRLRNGDGLPADSGAAKTGTRRCGPVRHDGHERARDRSRPTGAVAAVPVHRRLQRATDLFYSTTNVTMGDGNKRVSGSCLGYRGKS
ncbi:uncharacterized protein LOC123397274 [Hordeum vulgare subsp. vulgare]|uniref:uncharacterized protein LOC123397274 n=1 Tax=Hordeum vulgare subsp. vulgare TaxID=112509 RepID=UPI001D1A3CDF|nr:uncharacterized protein LOC123397274 [Hordeum vulgare subsp. vulgare]